MRVWKILASLFITWVVMNYVNHLLTDYVHQVVYDKVSEEAIKYNCSVEEFNLWKVYDYEWDFNGIIVCKTYRAPFRGSVKCEFDVTQKPFIKCNTEYKLGTEIPNLPAPVNGFQPV